MHMKHFNESRPTTLLCNLIKSRCDEYHQVPMSGTASDVEGILKVQYFVNSFEISCTIWVNVPFLPLC